MDRVGSRGVCRRRQHHPSTGINRARQFLNAAHGQPRYSTWRPQVSHPGIVCRLRGDRCGLRERQDSGAAFSASPSDVCQLNVTGRQRVVASDGPCRVVDRQKADRDTPLHVLTCLRQQVGIQSVNAASKIAPILLVPAEQPRRDILITFRSAQSTVHDARAGSFHGGK